MKETGRGYGPMLAGGAACVASIFLALDGAPREGAASLPAAVSGAGLMIVGAILNARAWIARAIDRRDVS